MKKIIRLTESELISVIKKIILEQPSKGPLDVFKELEDYQDYSQNFKMDETSVTLGKTKLSLGPEWTNFFNENIKGKKIQHLHKYNDELNIGIETPTRKKPNEYKTVRFKIKNPQ